MNFAISIKDNLVTNNVNIDGLEAREPGVKIIIDFILELNV